MDLTTGLVIGIVLFLGILLPFLAFAQRRGKAKGHTWFTRRKPRGHGDIGPDIGGPRPTRHNVDDARGQHH